MMRARTSSAVLKVAVITGSGGAFAARAGIAQLREPRRDDALRGIHSGNFDRIRGLPMPTIALVEGHTMGGGAELAYARDFRIGTPRVKLGNPEAGLGILAAAGATWCLNELVGEPLAKELLLTGRALDAGEAAAVRLLNEGVNPEDLEAAGQRWAGRVAKQPPVAVRLAKSVVSVVHAPREAHPWIADIAQAVLFETTAKHDRMTAFPERRKEEQ